MATHPPYPLMGNCKGHAETTTVQQGSETQGAVKHKADCLSQRTKDCVSLWGIPLFPLAPCVYNRFVWPQKVMWVKKRKEERGEWWKGKRTSVCGDVCALGWVWACARLRVRVHMCEWVVSVRGIGQGLEASGGHAQFQLASPQSAQTHLENTSSCRLELKGRLAKSQTSIRDKPFPRKIVKLCPQLGMWWDIWRSRERNLSSCD